MKIGLSILLLTLTFFASFVIPTELHEFSIQGYAQGTTYSIKYFAEDNRVSKDEIDSILIAIDSSMSLYKSYSFINKFNLSERGSFVDGHFKNVLQRSFEINRDSKGLFDITVAPLVSYWGFGPKTVPVSPVKKLSDLLPCVGMKNIRLVKDSLFKTKPCVQVDVNGIAQGYAVDVVANYLLLRGISSFLVEIGGEIRVNGKKPDGKLMKVGIEGPGKDSSKEPIIQHIVSLESGAITTSGNYRNYLIKDNKKISHLINPKTGSPLTNEMVSATVYAADAITADGYDNVLMAMSIKEALAFVNKRKHLDAYLIYRRQDGKLVDTATAGFLRLMVK